jgi:hypothetical protein
MTKEYRQPTEDEISVRAYYLWERDGRPHGRDVDYWIKAKDQLNCERQQGATTTTKQAPAVAAADPKSAAAKKKPTTRTPAFA